MKKLLLLVFGFISFGLSAQIITPQSSSGRGVRFLGGVQVDSTFILPVRDSISIYPNFQLMGRLQLNVNDSLIEYHNGTRWKRLVTDGTQDLQNVLEQGSTGSVNTAVTITSNDSSNTSILQLSADVARLEYNGNYIEVQEEFITASSTVRGEDGVEPNEFVTKGQLVGYSSSKLNDFFISVTVESGIINYKTDTYRTFDMNDYVPAADLQYPEYGVYNGNAVLEADGDLVFLFNNTNESADYPALVVRLYNPRVVNNVLEWDETKFKEFDVTQRIHDIKFDDGFLYGVSRVETANVGTIPTQITKINANDFTDIQQIDLPIIDGYVGKCGSIEVYKNKIYGVLMQSISSARLFSVDTDLSSHSILTELGDVVTRRIPTQIPISIYREQIYLPTMDFSTDVTRHTTVGISVYSLNGELIRNNDSIVISSDDNKDYRPHWMTIFNDRILLTPTGTSVSFSHLLVRIKAADLTLDTDGADGGVLTLPHMITNDNSLFSNGYLYLNGEGTGATLIKVKYNDFTDLTTEITPYNSNGSINPVIYKGAILSKTSQLENDSFIPLTGTEVGAPVTGDIEFGTYTRIKSNNTEVEGEYSEIEFDEASLAFSSFGLINSGYFNLSTNGFFISSDDPLSKGITTDIDFTPNITDLDYVQKKYVDNNFLSLAGNTFGTGISAPVYIVNDNPKIYFTRSDNGGTIEQTSTSLNISASAFGGTNKIKLIGSELELYVSGGLPMAFTHGAYSNTLPNANGTIALQEYVDSFNTPSLVTTSVSISTDPNWNGKIIQIDNGANNINLTVNDLITTAFTKLGTGTITIIAGTKTLYLADTIDECDGIKGSTFLLSPDLTTANQITVMITNR